LLVEVVVLGQADGMGKPTRLGVVEDSICDVALAFEEPAECEAGLWVTG